MKNAKDQPLTRREKRELAEKSRAVSLSQNFNRNQTISGYRAEESERMENRKLVIRRRKISGFFIGLMAASILIFIILLQLVIKISVVAPATKLNQPEKYAQAIDSYYNARPIERLQSYLDKQNLLNELQREYPEIEDITGLRTVNLTNYKFELKFRQPVAAWKSGSAMLYVDSNGVSFTKNYYDEPKIIISDESALQVSSGKTIASNSFIGFIGRLISAAQQKELTVSKISIPPASLRQVEVTLDGVKFPVKMLTTASVEGQVNNLVSAINYFNQHQISPSYLDLRVEGKGYYK